MKIAEAISATSQYPRIKIGAVIVKKNDIVSVGINAKKSHPMQKKYNIRRDIKTEIEHNIHAEMAALIKTKEDLRGADVYVYRNNATGNTAMSKPCKACEAALYARGVRKVVYTTNMGIAVEYYSE